MEEKEEEKIGYQKISRFEVSMHDSLVMKVFHSQRYIVSVVDLGGP